MSDDTDRPDNSDPIALHGVTHEISQLRANNNKLSAQTDYLRSLLLDIEQTALGAEDSVRLFGGDETRTVLNALERIKSLAKHRTLTMTIDQLKEMFGDSVKTLPGGITQPPPPA